MSTPDRKTRKARPPSWLLHVGSCSLGVAFGPRVCKKGVRMYAFKVSAFPCHFESSDLRMLDVSPGHQAGGRCVLASNPNIATEQLGPAVAYRCPAEYFES